MGRFDLRRKTPPLTQEEALAIAKRWYGKHAFAELDEGETEPCAIGYWRPEVDEHECCVTAIGRTWNAAFKDADPRWWRAERLRLAKMDRGGEEQGDG